MAHLADATLPASKQQPGMAAELRGHADSDAGHEVRGALPRKAFRHGGSRCIAPCEPRSARSVLTRSDSAQQTRLRERRPPHPPSGAATRPGTAVLPRPWTRRWTSHRRCKVAPRPQSSRATRLPPVTRGPPQASSSGRRASGPPKLAPPPPPRTKWTRRVPHPVLIGHAASLTPY